LLTLSDKEVTGQADLILYDAITDKEITSKMMEAMHGKFQPLAKENSPLKKDKALF
jgi:siroheme synthase